MDDVSKPLWRRDLRQAPAAGAVSVSIAPALTGMVLLVIGGTIAATNWPAVALAPDPLGFGPIRHETGSVAATAAGIAVAAVGHALLLVDLIARGVRRGTRGCTGAESA